MPNQMQALRKVLRDGIQHEIERIDRARSEIIKLQEELAEIDYDPTFEERQLWASYTGQILRHYSALGTPLHPDREAEEISNLIERSERSE